MRRNPAATIKVSSISDELEDGVLQSAFESLGKIKSVFISRAPGTQESKRAFIEYENESDAKAAIEKVKIVVTNNLISLCRCSSTKIG